MSSNLKQPLVAALRPALAALIGLSLGVALTAFAGENPWQVFMVILRGAIGTPYDAGMTLFYATPLILTGLAVALPYRAGLFNIGAEGQLLMGALAVAVVGVLLPTVSAPMSLLVSVLAAFAAGALWGGIAGWLRAYRGSHEVITTIMLNFIAAGLTSWVVLALIPSQDSQNPESARISANYMLEHFSAFSSAPVTWALPLAVVTALLVWLFLRFTVRGYELKATGLSIDAARFAGINVRFMQMLAMALGGGIAGLVGIAEVCGNSSRFRLGFSPDYGFIGIPVALMARAHPLGAVASALLFAVLQKGTAELDLETTYVTRDLAAIIQAMVVLAVAAEGGFTWLKWRRAKPEVKNHA